MYVLLCSCYVVRVKTSCAAAAGATVRQRAVEKEREPVCSCTSSRTEAAAASADNSTPPPLFLQWSADVRTDNLKCFKNTNPLNCSLSAVSERLEQLMFGAQCWLFVPPLILYTVLRSCFPLVQCDDLRQH